MTFLDPSALPDRIETEGGSSTTSSASRLPRRARVDALARLDGDLIILGVGGKMGPTLARMAVARGAGAGALSASRASPTPALRDR